MWLLVIRYVDAIWNIPPGTSALSVRGTSGCTAVIFAIQRAGGSGSRDNFGDHFFAMTFVAL